MRDRPLRRILSALLPRDLKREVFEPSLHDLDADRARTGRRRADAGVLLLFVNCWRLAPAEVLSMFLISLRQAFRLLRRDPGFTIAAVLTLTLGVGANVAVFAVVNGVLLRPLPYDDAERLVLLQHRDRRTGVTKSFIAMGDYVDLHARQRAFESFAAYEHGRTVVYGEGDPYDAASLAATPDLLAALRMIPFAGRGFEPGDLQPKAPPVVVLGYDLWQKQFGGDRAIVGRSLEIGRTPLMRQVVGIAPPGFRFPPASATDVIFPMTIPAAAPAIRKNGWTFAAARLKPGLTMEEAAAQLTSLSRQMEDEHPTQNQGSAYFAVPIRDAMLGETQPALVLLLAAVGLVLLIACANVANLLAARSLGRRQEMAVRVALGAGRRQIAIQLVAEAVALACVSAACALLFAYWATPALISLVPASVNLGSLAEIRIDRNVLLFAAAVTLATTCVFSVFSGMGIRDSPSGRLVSAGRVTTGAVVRRATSTLVAAEIALAIVLLSGAGLVLRSFSKLLSVDPGFRSDGVLTLEISVPSDRYRDVAAREALHQQIFDAIGRIPQVQAAGAATVTPLTGNNWTVPFERTDRPVPAGQRPPDVGWQSATGDYFRVLEIPLRAGRLFSTQDGPRSAAVVIVSEAVQDQFFPGESAVGRKVKLQDADAEIVGVVGNIRRAALTDSPRADMYFPQEHSPGTATTLFIRTSGDTAALIPELRSALRGVEPSMVLRGIRSMNEVTRESVEVTRLVLWLLGLFAATALTLAAVGIYGVMAYAVRQRLREIGTRVALGATPASILWLVLGQGAKIAGIGTAIGLAISVVAGQALRRLLFSTTPGDPVVLAAAAVLLLMTALIACYVPALRATRVDPVQTLAAH